jgi:ABC-type multidrug transport system ATPase subunit
MILLDKIPDWWSWMAEISVFRYFLELCLQTQWSSYGDIPCDLIAAGGGRFVRICPFPNGAAVLDFYGLRRARWICVLVILVWWVVFKVLGYRALCAKCRPAASAFGGPPPDDATAETMPSADGENALLATTPTAAKGGSMLRRTIEPLEVSWRGLGLTIPVPDAEGKKKPVDKRILSGLAGSAKPGELIAVMGGSGSGKSTLLRCLGGKQSDGVLDGEVLFNGHLLSPGMARHVAFMGQEDHFLAEITVHEHLLFHASLRMDRDISTERRQERVMELMGALGLMKVKDTLIGAIGGGISGGERRRLTYASELLQESSVLYLDEATSGLDSSMAEMVVKTLRVAADQGTTVICTIHQPSAKVFALFDKLLLLSNGKGAYFGPAATALDHFSSLGYPCTEGVDGVEHMMALCDSTPSEDADEEANRERRAGTIVAAAGKQSAAVVPRTPAAADKDLRGVAGTSRFDTTFKVQLAALVGREMLVRKRSKLLTKAVLGRTLVISFLMSTVYLQAAKDQQGVFSITGALSFVVINHVFTYVIGQATTMPLALPTLRRENQANMYGASAWYLSKTLTDLPFDLGTTGVLATICYWSIGFTSDPLNYLFFMLMLVLVALLSTGFGHLAGTVTYVIGRPNLAVPVVMLFLFPMFLFGGLLINFNNCPDYRTYCCARGCASASTASCDPVANYSPLRSTHCLIASHVAFGTVVSWLMHSSIFYYAFSLITRNQWTGFGAIKCSSEDAAATGTGRCAFNSGDDALTYFGISKDNQARDLSVVIALIVIFRVVCEFLLYKMLNTRPAVTAGKSRVVGHASLAVELDKTEQEPMQLTL